MNKKEIAPTAALTARDWKSGMIVDPHDLLLVTVRRRKRPIAAVSCGYTSITHYPEGEISIVFEIRYDPKNQRPREPYEVVDLRTSLVDPLDVLKVQTYSA